MCQLGESKTDIIGFDCTSFTTAVVENDNDKFADDPCDYTDLGHACHGFTIEL